MNPFASWRRRRPFLVELRGGLGNQLFIYSAAKYLEANEQIRLVFDESGIDHGDSIISFARGECGLRTRTFGQKVYRRLYIWLYFRRRQTLNVDSQVNLSDLCLDISNYSRLKGFFQTFSYYQSLSSQSQDKMRDFFNPSEWARNQAVLVQSENSILMHIRGGDYLTTGERLGLLSSSFYEDSLRRLSFDSQTKILVLTDDSNYATHLLENLPLPFIILDGPKSTGISDAIFLMTHAKKLIIANSSFSFWGALLNREGVEVCFPFPWFIKDDFAYSAFPKEWICVRSTWRQLQI